MAIGNRRRLKRTRGILNLQAQSATVGVRNVIEGTIIDWSTANVYTKDVSLDQSFSFINDEDGKSISIILKNTSDSPVTVSFPGGLRKKTTLQNTLQPNTQSVYSLVKAGNNIYIHQDVFDTLTEFPDTDGDGVTDNLDIFPNDATESVDSDGDGVGDNSDAFPNDATETVDTDGDGVGDNSDNAPLVENPDQADLDQDGIADVLDSDIDGDGVVNELDAFPNDSTRFEDPNFILGNYIQNDVLVDSQGNVTYSFENIHSFLPNPLTYQGSEVTSISKIGETKILLSGNAYRTETTSTQTTLREPESGEYAINGTTVGSVSTGITSPGFNGSPFSLSWNRAGSENVGARVNSFPYTFEEWTYHLGSFSHTIDAVPLLNFPAKDVYGVYRTRIIESTSTINVIDVFDIEYDIVSDTYDLISLT